MEVRMVSLSATIKTKAQEVEAHAARAPQLLGLYSRKDTKPRNELRREAPQLVSWFLTRFSTLGDSDKKAQVAVLSSFVIYA